MLTVGLLGVGKLLCNTKFQNNCYQTANVSVKICQIVKKKCEVRKSDRHIFIIIYLLLSAVDC